MEEEEKTGLGRFSDLNQIKISDIIFITLKRWPWLLLSIVVCVGLGWVYVERTTPIYTRSASITIKDKESGGTAPEGFSKIGLFQSNSSVTDAINSLTSPDIMAEVVRRLNLDMNYSVSGPWHPETLYGSNLPITLSCPTMLDTESLSAEIDIKADGHYKIKDLKINDRDVNLPTKSNPVLGDTIITSDGPIVVAATPYLKKGQSYNINVNRTPLRTAVAHYSSHLSVTQRQESNTINLVTTDVSTQRAEDLLNSVISVYNEQWIENRNQVAVSTSNFINERLAVIERELGNVDQDISNYQSEHLIPNVQQAASMYMSENQAVNAQILALNNQLQMTRYMRSYLANESNKNSVLPANTGINNSTIEGQINTYNSTMIERNNYVANSSETHPVVMDLDSRLAAMRAAILSTIDNQIVSLNTQIQNAQSNKSRTTALLAANPTQAKYLLSVERQQKVKESLYVFLLQKREENELSQAFTAYNTQIISHPHGSNVPTSPQRGKILMMSFIIGLVLPFGFTFLRETLNTTVRGRKDIEGLSIPFLGEIPTSPAAKGEKTTGRVVVRQGKRNVINEAFRVLRTNLGFMSSRSNGTETVMVTSFNPGSGKTFLAVNLGISLAIKGKRVLIIDGDMRRCSTSEYVDKPKRGLSDYLAGAIDDIHSLIVADTISEGLSILPVGTIPPNPTELLEGERFSEMVKNLKGLYDYIIIDCPPVEMMADAQIVSSVVDRTIFVIRAGLMERAMLPEIERLYEGKKYPNMCVILNATAAKGSRYGYKYGYGYGYGYGNYSHYTSAE